MPGSLELPCQYEEDGKHERGRGDTAVVQTTAKNGRLHHFILGFERFHNEDHTAETEKTQLMRYYEQMKQSILENGELCGCASWGRLSRCTRLDLTR